MHYLVSVIDDKTGSATPTEMAAIDAFNDRLEAQGHWVVAGAVFAICSRHGETFARHNAPAILPRITRTEFLAPVATASRRPPRLRTSSRCGAPALR
jgi:hypothetical protein